MKSALLIILPALGLVLGPRLWVNRVLKQYDVAQDCPDVAQKVARHMLDRHGLYAVAVEQTDIGDHYDPDSRTVRLSRKTFDRASLTAITIASHEVAHAQQHAIDYPPLIWRDRLARVAQVTGVAGTVLIIALPLTLLLTRRPLPPPLAGRAALVVLGTGMAAQLAALSTELDASFGRALPMLRQGYITDEQAKAAHRILYACSLTYLAAPLAGVLHIWPWLRRVRGRLFFSSVPDEAVGPAFDVGLPGPQLAEAPIASDRRHTTLRGGSFEAGLRRLIKPLVRLLIAVSDSQHGTGGVVCDPRRDRPE